MEEDEEEETIVTIIGEAMEVHVTTTAVEVTTMTVDRSMEEEEIVAEMTVVEVKSSWDLMFRLLLIGYAVTATKFLGNSMLHGMTIWQFFNLERL